MNIRILGRGHKKLSREQVNDIIDNFYLKKVTGRVSIKVLAEKYGVALSTIWKIKEGLTYNLMEAEKLKNPETLFKEKVMKYLKFLPNTYYWKNDQRAIRGIPDITGCINGFFFALELKRSKTAHRTVSKGDKLQVYTLNRITKCGGFGLITYPEIWEETREILRALARGEAYDTNDLRYLKGQLLRERSTEG